MSGSYRSLETLDDDTLIYIFAFLPVPDILCMRQTCRRMNAISALRAIWHNACLIHVVQEGFPFPNRPLTSMSAPELEQRTRYAYHLGTKWMSSSPLPRSSMTFEANPDVQSTQFLPGLGGKWVATVSRGIWSIISIWHLGSPPAKIAEWSGKGAHFWNLVVNTDPESEATVAVSVSRSQGPTKEYIDILSLRRGLDDATASLSLVKSIETSHRAITLQGDIIALSNQSDETRILDWKSGGEAVLRDRREDDLPPAMRNNRCLQIVFAYKSILVVRAHTMNLFPQPTLTPDIRVYQSLACHSFGWMDSIAVTEQVAPSDRQDSYLFQPLSIMLREDNDDPWSLTTCTVNLYQLEPDPTYVPDISDTKSTATATTATQSPYLFPPVFKSRLSSVRGFLRCHALFLGRFGTALWVQPREPGHFGLTSLDVHGQDAQVAGPPPANESLMATVFPGPLGSSKLLGVARKLWTNDSGYWVSLDYDEEMGLVALGTNRGEVTVLQL